MGTPSRAEKPSPERMERGPRRLYKSRKNRVIDGVCGGLGEYLDMDPTLIRVGWVVLALLWGSGIVAYLVAMIVMPRRAVEKAESETREEEGLDSQKWWGVLLIVVGLILLINSYIPQYHHLWFWWQPMGRLLWPLFLVVIGLWILGKQLRRSTIEQEQRPATAGARKKLCRSTSERMVAGVCGGMADFWRTDPSIVRIIWVLVTLASAGLGILVYVIMWILVPERAGEERES